MDPQVRAGFKSINFSTYTKEDIEKISIMPITSGGVFDHSGIPIKNGVYDLKLGSTENNQICPTCGQNAWNCPGHFAHIKLVKPVYHPFYADTLANLIAGICPVCHNMRVPVEIVDNVTNALKLLDRGQVIDYDIFEIHDSSEENESQYSKEDIRKLIKSLPLIPPNSYCMQERASIYKKFLDFAKDHSATCSNCQYDSPNERYKYNKANFEFQNVSNKPVPIETIRDLIEQFYDNNKEFFHEFFSDRGPSIFFIDDVCVPPPKFRPASVLGDKINSHPSSSALSEIQKSNEYLRRALYPNTTEPEQNENEEPELDDEQDQEAKNTDDNQKNILLQYRRLQNLVNSFFDNTLSKSTKKRPHGIRQILEKKEGLFRKNLMGKRVNFSARSVIAPDPYISTDEIGVPEVFAKTLSYPEKVTEFNKEKLSQLIKNGPDVYPGANFITNGDGRTYKLHGMSEQERNKYATMLYSNDGKMPIVVGRHAMDGDFVLINRQPTLHRVSILAMRCKILPNQKTIRMHYSNCASFNADFDGDEINLHLPQSELGRGEAKELALSSIHYVTPTAGNPIRGLIQDHVDAGAMLTMKNKFFTKSQYQQLVYAAFSNEADSELIMLEPALILPQQLWTGKQVISTLLVNLTKDKNPLELASKSKFTKKILDDSEKEEEIVYIRYSQLMHGIIDKAQYGASTYGLVHSLFELYGSNLANRFLTMLTRLFTFYMQTHGHTCGIDDMFITRRAEKERKKKTVEMKAEAEKAAAEFVEEFGSEKTKGLPVKERLMDIIQKPGIKDRFDTSQKNAINPKASEIINYVYPNGLNKPFPNNCLLLMCQSGAKGSVVNVSQISALLGQQELEGRRVPLMASCKALPSFEPMDLSPMANGFISSRFLTGLKPQEYFYHCMAGREGLTDTAVKTANTGYLQRCIIKHIEGIHAAYDGTVRNSDDSIVEFLYGEDGIDPMNSKYLSTFDFMADNYEAYCSKLQISPELMSKVDCDSAMNILEENYKTEYDPETHQRFRRSDPIQSVFPPHNHVGSVSEKFEDALNEKCRQLDQLENPKVESHKLQALALLNYFKSIVHPGEAVGVIAAEAIGEPATQMTLNTFHLAGYGGTNVTLGIPRLKEILVVAQKQPATPTMTIPLKTQDVEEVEQFVDQFKRVPLREIVRSFKVRENFHIASDVRRSREIIVQLQFIKEKMEHWDVTGKIDLLQAKIATAIKKKISAIFKSTSAKIIVTDDKTETAPDEGTGHSKKQEKVNQRTEEMGADLAKQQSRKTEQNSYENEDDQAPSKQKGDKNNEEEEKAEDDDDETQFAVNQFDSKNLTMTISYSLQDVSVKILLESLVEDVLNETMIHEMKGVTRATYQQADNGTFVVTTEGCNVDEIIKSTKIDFTHFYTNNIGEILERFGIEAARTAIIKEIATVFYSYSIAVDTRHLNLIADYLTQTGEWLGMSRNSMKSCPSPIQQMSFETTCKFLTHATLHGEVDNISSPSACLAAGNVVKGGTGLCAILVPFE